MRTPIAHFLILSAVLFTIGTVGVLVRRNALVMFMSVELQLNAVNLALVTFSRMHNELDGQVLAFFSMVVAAAGVRTDDGWSVVLQRPLVVKSEDGLSLVPGGRVSVAFARWDGASRDRAGQKLISIWHDLNIE